jgi:hypothetical protein
VPSSSPSSYTKEAYETGSSSVNDNSFLREQFAAQQSIIQEDHKRKMSEARKGINRPNLWKSFKIINPDGILIEGSNISGFCKENNLYPDCFNKVLNGTQRHHKGWTKPVEEINK